MKRYINKSIDVLKKEGVIPFAKKMFKNVKRETLRRLDGSNKKVLEEWHQLKGKYKGKRVFLLGNGGSLNKTALYLLKNEYTMCFNRFNLFFERLSWKPTFYSCDDQLVAVDAKDDINNVIVPFVRKAFFPDYHRSGINFKKLIKKSENVLWYHQDFIDFSYDLPKVATGGTIAYVGLQILLYLGFSEVYIIGMDMDYKIHETASTLQGVQIKSNADDDPNHFDPRYFGKGKKYHQPVASILELMLKSMALANEKYKKTSTKLYNATLGGKVECFERVDFNSLFNHLSKEDKTKLFLLGFGEDFGTLDKLDNEYKYLLDYNDNQINFSITAEQGIKLISKLVSTHIALGPFNGKYYFKLRGVADKA